MEREEGETINSAVKDLIPSLARKPAGFLSFREADANSAYVKDTKKLHQVQYKCRRVSYRRRGTTRAARTLATVNRKFGCIFFAHPPNPPSRAVAKNPSKTRTDRTPAKKKKKNFFSCKKMEKDGDSEQNGA